MSIQVKIKSKANRGKPVAVKHRREWDALAQRAATAATKTIQEKLTSSESTAKGKPRKARGLWFEKPFRRVVWLASADEIGLDRLPAKERATILKSVTDAAYGLALTTSRYNASAGQTKNSRGFDKYEFAFRYGKYLPAIAHKFADVIQRNDFDGLLRLAKQVAAVKKHPAPEEADPLGHFLVRNWVNQRTASRVPPFCMLSAAVLKEVCDRCLAEGISAKIKLADIDAKICRLGLRRAKSVKIGSCARRGALLFVAEETRVLREYERNTERALELIC